MTESGLQAHPPILNNLRNFSGICRDQGAPTAGIKNGVLWAIWQ